MDLRKYKFKLSLLLILLIAIYIIPLDYIEGRSFCLYYNVFHIKCFGCGFTRAFFNMTRLNIIEAISYNKMILILGPLFVIIFIWNIIDTIKILKNKHI